MSSLSYRAIADTQLNYFWPQYSLPWNNFFGRVQATPYYIQNQMRNLAVREKHSPLAYTSKTVVNYLPNASAPVWSNIIPGASKVLTETATKVFVGKYFDNAADISGDEYQYDFVGTHVFVNDQIQFQDNGLVVMAFDLYNLSNTVNLPVYVDTAICDPCNQIYQSSSLNRCQTGPSNNFFNTLSGFVKIGGNTIPLWTALPYNSPAVKCPNSSNVLYSIQGNRLFISVQLETPASPNDRFVNFEVTLRVVEADNPLKSAIAPILDIPPYY